MSRIHKKAALMAVCILIPTFVFAEEVPAPAAPPEPVEIRRGMEEGLPVLEKIYVLPNTQNGDLIPRDDFEEEEVSYQFAELKTQDNAKEEVKEYSQQKTIHTDTNNTQSVIAKFPPTLEVSTEDGYAGVLHFDYTTLNVSASGYGTETYQVNESRTYPNLVSADISLVPKTITKDGNTLNLTGIEWQESAADQIDGHELAVRYTANATYTGTATRTYTKGYTASAYYKGEVKKMVNETTTYTARFKGKPKPTPTPAPAPEEPPQKSIWSYWWLWLLGAAVLGGGGFGIYRFVRKRKKGY